MEYKLNISEKDFNNIYSGSKKFLIRNDKIDFKIGDTLILEEFTKGKNSGNVLYRIISFIENDSTYLKNNFIILGVTESSKLYT